MQRSTIAEQEIKTLIDYSVQQVKAGTRLVGEVGTTMHHVVSSVQRLSNIAKEISNASNEQSSGIDQINIAVLSMDNVTQQNPALAEEAAFTCAIARPLSFFSQLCFKLQPIDIIKNVSRSIYDIRADRKSYNVEIFA